MRNHHFETLSQVEYTKMALALQTKGLYIENTFHMDGYLSIDVMNIISKQPHLKTKSRGTMTFSHQAPGMWVCRYHHTKYFDKTPLRALNQILIRIHNVGSGTLNKTNIKHDYTAKDIQRYINKYNESNIQSIHNSLRDDKFIFAINTEWLNEMQDSISVYLIKKDSRSPWIITDDGSTLFECRATGLFDKKDLPLKAWKFHSKNMRGYFTNAPIEFDPKIQSYNLKFDSLKDLDDNLHYYLQTMVELISDAVLTVNYRDLKRNSKNAIKK